jgi:hypothetical protein
LAPHQRPAPASAARRAGDAAPSSRGLPQQQRRAGPARAGVIASASTLAELPFASIINTQGLIQPEVPDGAEASVLAIYDENQKLQYVGFSKDLRNTLRTLLSRRTDKAFYFKAEHLQSVDQGAMVALRDAWFAEVRAAPATATALARPCTAARGRARPPTPLPPPAHSPPPAAQVGGPPIGNKLAQERAAWQKPMEAFAISERGKPAAAEELVKTQQQALRDRGCQEEFVPNLELLPLGQVGGGGEVALPACCPPPSCYGAGRPCWLHTGGAGALRARLPPACCASLQPPAPARPRHPQVDFLASKALSAEELAEQQRRVEEATRRKKVGAVVVDGGSQRSLPRQAWPGLDWYLGQRACLLPGSNGTWAPWGVGRRRGRDLSDSSARLRLPGRASPPPAPRRRAWWGGPSAAAALRRPVQARSRSSRCCSPASTRPGAATWWTCC